MEFFRIIAILVFSFDIGADAFAQNGTDRGGGDEYVEKFQVIKREVLGQMDTWVQNGTLKLSKSDLQKFRMRVSHIKIYSKDRVYLDPKDFGTEVSFLNQKSLLRITIGRKRWDETELKIDPLGFSLIILHELLSVVGIRDAEFEKSYHLRTVRAQEWQNLKKSLREIIDRECEVALEMLKPTTLNVAKTFVETLFMDSNYLQCVALGADSQDKASIQRYCGEFFKRLEQVTPTIIDKYIEPIRQTHALADRQIQKDWRAVQEGISHSSWREWASLFEVSYRFKVVAQMDFIEGDFDPGLICGKGKVSTVRFLICAHESLMNYFSKIEAERAKASLEIKTIHKEGIKDLDLQDEGYAR